MIQEYLYFGLRPVAVKNNGSLNIVHTDYLGTPRIISSGLNIGSVMWQWKNDNIYGNNPAIGSIDFNLRFAGQYYDYESGIHYNMFRTYNPELGRYMQSDPIGLAGGFNTYNYVNKNPLDGVDPLGLIDWGSYSLPKGLVNYVAKIGDVLSLGTTYITRENLEINQSIYAINEKWKAPNENEINCFINKEKVNHSGFDRGNNKYKYNNSYAIAEHYDFSRFMSANFGILGVGVMMVEIPRYNISKNILPFMNDEDTSPPTWLDVKYFLKGVLDGFVEMHNENRKIMARGLRNN